MKRTLLLICIGLLAWTGSGTRSLAPGTAFTYQGRLDHGGSPAHGAYDLRFAVYDAEAGGSPQGPTLTRLAVPVNEGLFSVTLDFGAGVFTGQGRWLEIGVRPAGGDAFTVLSPRQPIHATPHALYALTPAGPAGSADAWSRTGNAGTTPAVNFLGTTDEQPFEVRVNNTRALRIEPTANDVNGSDIVNVIAGASANPVGAEVHGVTISGGGIAHWGDFTGANRVEANFGTIGGGVANTILPKAPYATIGGGARNTIEINAQIAMIAGGGVGNTIQTNARLATIGGGWENTIQTNASRATIGGGAYRLTGTVGQPDAGGPLTGGNFSLTGGFWALPLAVQTPDAPTLTIVPAAPGFATIAWTPATGTTWVLQFTPTLEPAAWADAPSGATNPVTVPATQPAGFYRLIRR